MTGQPSSSQARGEPASPSNRPSSAGDPARAAALAVILAAVKAFPELTPALMPRTEGLDARDAAFAHAIWDAARRRWLTLSSVLGSCLSGARGFDALGGPVKAALLGGAAQMLLLDRVPDHAAVDRAVTWARSRAGAGAAGLVNAVLRRVARIRVGVEAGPWRGEADAIPLSGGRVLRFSQAVLAAEERERWWQAASVGRSIVEGWRAQATEEDARAWCLRAVDAAPVVINGCAAMGTELEPALDAAIEQHERAGFWVLEASGSGDSPGAWLERFPGTWIQDAGSASWLDVVRPMAGEPRIVLDLCAGRGTKTRQLAWAFPGAVILAHEPDAGRRRDLAAAFERHPRVRLMEGGDAPAADLVLLDVPCSNTGVLPRRPEARYRERGAMLERLCKVQREIIDRAAGMVTPGGLVVYSTCSLEREENEEQAAWAVERHGWTLVAERRERPSGPGVPAREYRDAAYVAVWRTGR